MFCKNCGEKNKDNVDFCKGCGIKLKGNLFSNNNRSQKIKNIFWWIVGIAILGFCIYSALSPEDCNFPIKYSIGDIDSRFKISKAEIVETLKDAESRWDNQTRKNVLEYDENSSMKINFIYDQRQTDLDEFNAQVSSLNLSGESIDTWGDKIETLISTYEKDLEQYNSKVDYWNMRGGAPSYTYNQLLNQQVDLEKRRQAINKYTNSLNTQVNEHNSNLQELKDKIEQNKNKIQTVGLYYPDQNKIDIFTFVDKDELRLVLMHELGHALGISGHAQDQKSIMFATQDTTDQTATKDPKLSEEDVDLLSKKCNLK